jgi:thymidylate synthase
MTQEKLEKYYTENLKKVLKAYRHDCRKIDYIKYAIQQLREVRNGRGW